MVRARARTSPGGAVGVPGGGAGQRAPRSRGRQALEAPARTWALARGRRADCTDLSKTSDVSCAAMRYCHVLFQEDLRLIKASIAFLPALLAINIVCSIT